jgi:hypothetical protein
MDDNNQFTAVIRILQTELVNELQNSDFTALSDPGFRVLTRYVLDRMLVLDHPPMFVTMSAEQRYLLRLVSVETAREKPPEGYVNAGMDDLKAFLACSSDDHKVVVFMASVAPLVFMRASRLEYEPGGGEGSYQEPWYYSVYQTITVRGGSLQESGTSLGYQDNTRSVYLSVFRKNT